MTKATTEAMTATPEPKKLSEIMKELNVELGITFRVNERFSTTGLDSAFIQFDVALMDFKKFGSYKPINLTFGEANEHDFGLWDSLHDEIMVDTPIQVTSNILVDRLIAEVDFAQIEDSYKPRSLHSMFYQECKKLVEHINGLRRRNAKSDNLLISYGSGDNVLIDETALPFVMDLTPKHFNAVSGTLIQQLRSKMAYYEIAHPEFTKRERDEYAKRMKKRRVRMSNEEQSE